MLFRSIKVMAPVALICFLSGCSTTKLSSEKLPGEELSREVLSKKVTQTGYLLKELDRYSVTASVRSCTADYVRTQNSERIMNHYEIKNCVGAAVLTSLYYPIATLYTFGLYPIMDMATGFKKTKEQFQCSTTAQLDEEAGQGVMTREFLDAATTTCTETPVSAGTVEVAYGEETLKLKPSAAGIVRLPLRHVGYLENLDRKSTIVWQYEGTRLSTTSNHTPAQRQETVRNYLNKLEQDQLFTMQLDDRSGFYKGDDKLMSEIRKELPKYYHLEKIANPAPAQKVANLPAKSQNRVARPAGAQENRLAGGGAARASGEDQAMNRVARSENQLAPGEEAPAYRLVPSQRNLVFRSGEYTGSIELPVIGYSENPEPVQVQAKIMSRKVNSLLPKYENEDRNLKVALRDNSMSLINKGSQPLRLERLSLYYNGKFVDNILERPMELLPGAQGREIPVAAVMERELGLLAKYGSLNAEQAQRMKINFGLGAYYQDPQSKAPAMMNKVNSYSVYDMVKNMAETERLDQHMLSLVEEKSMAPAELRQMFSASLKQAEAYDPTELQFDLDIEFDPGKAVIKKEYLDNLNKVGSAMRNYPSLKGVIEGHCDNVGSEDINQSLSRRRAEAVKQYLVQSFGIDPARLQAEGFGMSRPRADNDSAAGRAQNRRIEGRIMEFGA